jgi:hypothetical protein
MKIQKNSYFIPKNKSFTVAKAFSLPRSPDMMVAFLLGTEQ